ncbi:pyridoxal phosphate-dependent aminotransferase [Sulfobacillus harzensis]|uniref:Aminotransferase class I/II-fold pyridoxal phosphate-dependent enzyme n=1 Tax=Sulfobacillus harzensis TaxID=2729629 RepID=A0A7Y0L5P9_9FIRM|nr:aminotransferase class I/II-fold pyridoxal phosphate-dependent enzyme [Sulfobacillus harzensis]NMP23695.1 aminotransferase class I/II-fold pyridoxal phosphate-dependent enzyme [Sulfobacillus harzensis]
MDVKPAVHGGQVHTVARALGLPLSNVLDFSANINPLGPPESVRQALMNALDDIRFYPDATQAEAKHVIADRHGVFNDNVLISNGATEAIDLALRALSPNRVWILEPAFSEYRAAAQRNRLPVVSVPLERPDFVPPWGRLAEEMRPGDCLIWNNPHNPSGRHVARSHFSAPVRALAERGVALLIDESFIDFLDDEPANTAISEALQPGSRVIVVRSLTKYLAIPGLRFGYAIADQAWVASVERLRDRWSVGHLAQKAASVGLQDMAFRNATQNWLHQEQQQVAALWGPSALYQREPTAMNFFLLRWTDEDLSRRVSRTLFHRGILVRLCSDFDGLGSAYWRVAIRTRTENQRLHATVQVIVGEEGSR